jgi:hypothetical protein
MFNIAKGWRKRRPVKPPVKGKGAEHMSTCLNCGKMVGAWKHFDEAYQKACFSSRPQDWIDAELLARQVRNTHPPVPQGHEPKREPLTDEHIWQLVNDYTIGGDLHADKFARAIEAAHGIKENKCQ